MKRMAAVVLAVLLTAVSYGCSAEPPPSSPEPSVPVTDPQPGAPISSWVARAQVNHPERDPFAESLIEAAERERAEVIATSRDPFAPVDNVTSLPEPPDEPPPVDDNGDGDDPAPAGLLAVRVLTLDRCWLDVLVDGERVLRTNVPVGESLYWEGSDILFDQVGRDYALTVTLNGRNLGVLSQLVPALEAGPLTYEFDDVRVRITLSRRHLGGVLLGLRFRVY